MRSALTADPHLDRCGGAMSSSSRPAEIHHRPASPRGPTISAERMGRVPRRRHRVPERGRQSRRAVASCSGESLAAREPDT